MIVEKAFPKLYKRTSAGAIEQWEILVETDPDCTLQDGDDEPATIVTRHGIVGGKLQTGFDTITKGKNLGKANATTALKQALAEAESKWRKKIERNGYVEDAERAAAGETDAAGGIAPMLAQPFEKVKKLQFPLLFQRKYNGVRCIATVEDDGSVSLWSRKRERITCMPHIERAVAALEMPPGSVLDGELYVHGWTLQKIAQYVRPKTPKDGHEIVQYHVYDLPSDRGTNMNRNGVLAGWIMDAEHPIVWVPSTLVHSVEEAWKLHDAYVQDGYEGGIGRRPDAEYQPGRRSPDLIKFKRFEDHEFEIVGHKLGRGKFADIPVLVCKTEEGGEFDCNLPGTLEERRATDPTTLIGKKLTVRHFGWTDDKLPYIPVGVVVRDYE